MSRPGSAQMSQTFQHCASSPEGWGQEGTAISQPRVLPKHCQNPRCWVPGAKTLPPSDSCSHLRPRGSLERGTYLGSWVPGEQVTVRETPQAQDGHTPSPEDRQPREATVGPEQAPGRKTACFMGIKFDPWGNTCPDRRKPPTWAKEGRESCLKVLLSIRCQNQMVSAKLPGSHNVIKQPTSQEKVANA